MAHQRTTRAEMCQYECKGIRGYALVLGTGGKELEFRNEVLRRNLCDCVDDQQIRCAYFFEEKLFLNDRVDELLNFYDSFPWTA